MPQQPRVHPETRLCSPDKRGNGDPRGWGSQSFGFNREGLRRFYPGGFGSRSGLLGRALESVPCVSVGHTHDLGKATCQCRCRLSNLLPGPSSLTCVPTCSSGILLNPVLKPRDHIHPVLSLPHRLRSTYPCLCIPEPCCACFDPCEGLGGRAALSCVWFFLEAMRAVIYLVEI